MRLTTTISDVLVSHSSLIDKLHTVREAVLDMVLVPHLEISRDIGPAEFYVERCKIAIAPEKFIAVYLSEVVWSGHISPYKIKDLQKALKRFYLNLIQVNIEPEDRVQLEVSIMTTRALFSNGEHLFKEPAIWVLKEITHTR